MKVSATLAAEAAGLSRVTLHRIERGEPSVTMGAYLSAIAAVGLQLGLSDPQALTARALAPTTGLPASVRLAGYPQLKRMTWQRRGVAALSPADALSQYERDWRHIDHKAAWSRPNVRWCRPWWTGWVRGACLFEREHHRRIGASPPSWGRWMPRCWRPTPACLAAAPPWR